jgi:hypothetical protein
MGGGGKLIGKTSPKKDRQTTENRRPAYVSLTCAACGEKEKREEEREREKERERERERERE